jgi:polysaccharide export outer membrane protein
VRKFSPSNPINKLFTVLIVLSLASCSYNGKNILFKTQKRTNTKSQPVFVINGKLDTITDYKHRIKVGDRIQIRFLNNFDIGQGATQSATSAGNNANIGIADKGYMVNYDSTVTLPLLGRLILVGYTRLECAKKLEKEYSKYIINPIVDVNIASLSVTILGEVNSPGKILLDKENTTVVDIIALAGGFKDTGKKMDIKIIRGEEIIIVDLKQVVSLQSTKIIIHDNDIVYIEPYGVKALTEPIASLAVAGTLLLTATQLFLIALQIRTLTK